RRRGRAPARLGETQPDRPAPAHPLRSAARHQDQSSVRRVGPDRAAGCCLPRRVDRFAADRREPQQLPVTGARPAEEQDGVRLLEAVAVLNRLRSPGGCPWDAEQTHDSLRQYLVEETYELLDALESGDRVAIREELGDLLLQVLFHARVATEHETDPFTIDDVAVELVDKLVGRHPHVFGGPDARGDDVLRDAASQERRWEELKQVEKRRESSMDGVAFGQPAVALSAKLVQRALRAGVPAELLPSGDSRGERLFAEVAVVKRAGGEPEGELRAVAMSFAADMRATEGAARAAGVDPTSMSESDWRRFWQGHHS
ncbi:MAG: MazG family protein, partial [Sciscionella sp.]